MIVVNGSIRAARKTGGGLDKNGNPIKLSEKWTKVMDGRVTAIQANNLKIQNGNAYADASYEILIEERPFSYGRIKITRLGEYLGEFSVLSVEKLEAAGMVKIIV